MNNADRYELLYAVFVAKQSSGSTTRKWSSKHNIFMVQYQERMLLKSL